MPTRSLPQASSESISLTPAQRKALNRLALGPMDYTLYRTKQSTMRVLRKFGLAAYGSGTMIAITEKGRSFLKSEGT